MPRILFLSLWAGRTSHVLVKPAQPQEPGLASGPDPEGSSRGRSAQGPGPRLPQSRGGSGGFCGRGGALSTLEPSQGAQPSQGKPYLARHRVRLTELWILETPGDNAGTLGQLSGSRAPAPDLASATSTQAGPGPTSFVHSIINPFLLIHSLIHSFIRPLLPSFLQTVTVTPGHRSRGLSEGRLLTSTRVPRSPSGRL